MKPENSLAGKRRVLPVVSIVLALVAVFFWFKSRWTEIQIADAPATNNFPPPLSASAANAGTNPNVSNPVLAQFAAPVVPVPPHLFAAVKATGDYEWTAEDGRDTNVIRQLAHNDLEYERMVDENQRIHRRQLVYHKGAFSLAAQAARIGRNVSRLTLPGLDGNELSVDVLKTEFEAGGDRGNFSGKLAGRDNSMVTVAFIGGREAFTVVSPEDGLYLVAEPREPGQLVVKSINPDTYGGIFGEDDGIPPLEKK